MIPYSNLFYLYHSYWFDNQSILWSFNFNYLFPSFAYLKGEDTLITLNPNLVFFFNKPWVFLLIVKFSFILVIYWLVSFMESIFCYLPRNLLLLLLLHHSHKAWNAGVIVRISLLYMDLIIHKVILMTKVCYQC